MKKIIYLLLLFPFLLTAQTKEKNYNEFKYTHVLQCLIEIDGHIFDNVKSGKMISLKSTLECVTISDSDKEYEYRKCEVKNCNIVHLKCKAVLKIYGNSLFYTPTPAVINKYN